LWLETWADLHHGSTREEICLSVLTKVFVVLVAFLSVLLVALIIPFVANTEDFRVQLYQEATRRVGAEAAAREKQSEITRLQSGESERYALLQGDKRRLTDTIVQLTTEVAENQADVQLLESEKAKRDADMSRLTAAAEQLGQITDTQRTELSQRRSEAVSSNTRIIELEDTNNSLTSQLETLARQVRQFKEGKTVLVAKNKTYEEAMAKLDRATRDKILDTGQSDSETPYVPNFSIEGAVVGVDTMDDSTYVEVDLGQSDGVELNMKFWVHRGGAYVGNLVIVKVDTDKAAGRMTYTQFGLEVTVGDAVLTGSVGM
jgi:hypothetical protein